MATPIFGVDVSGYNPGIDFGVVPCDFVGVYLSGGTTTGNAHCAEQVASALKNGKRLMLYHFENDGTPGTPQQEAAWFKTMTDYLVSQVGPLPWNTLYALDNETSNAMNIPWQQQWLDITRNNFGSGAGMYGPFTNLITGAYQSLRDAGYFIWESAYILGAQAIYGYQVPGGRTPLPGGDPAIWQFTSTLRLNGWGGNLDGNVCLIGAEGWDALCGAGPTLNDDQQFLTGLGLSLP